jgi:hypothetical protein
MLGFTIDSSDFVDRFPVCLRWRVDRFVRRELYWLYLARTSLSMELVSFWSRSSSSEMDLSVRYLILFQEKVWRY